MITYWICTKDRRHVGEFSISEESVMVGMGVVKRDDKITQTAMRMGAKFILSNYLLACLRLGIDPELHTYCLAST